MCLNNDPLLFLCWTDLNVCCSLVGQCLVWPADQCPFIKPFLLCSPSGRRATRTSGATTRAMTPASMTTTAGERNPSWMTLTGAASTARCQPTACTATTPSTADTAHPVSGRSRYPHGINQSSYVTLSHSPSWVSIIDG